MYYVNIHTLLCVRMGDRPRVSAFGLSQCMCVCACVNQHEECVWTWTQSSAPDLFDSLSCVLTFTRMLECWGGGGLEEIVTRKIVCVCGCVREKSNLCAKVDGCIFTCGLSLNNWVRSIELHIYETNLRFFSNRSLSVWNFVFALYLCWCCPNENHFLRHAIRIKSVLVLLHSMFASGPYAIIVVWLVFGFEFLETLHEIIMIFNIFIYIYAYNKRLV